MGANVFFFSHSLVPPWGGTRSPGRVAYEARGRAINLQTSAVEDWGGTVYADGYKPNTPGTNIDPHVFSDVLPWHLSYCRICKPDPTYYVNGDPKLGLLSQVARRGDLVVFGDSLSMNPFFIDTVVCVTRSVRIPQQGGKLAVRELFQEYCHEVFRWRSASSDWNRFTSTLTYQHGLSDSLPGGEHDDANVDPYLQLLGRRKTPARLSRALITHDLLRGSGFNFIPLRTAYNGRNADVLARPGLFTAKIRHFRKRLTHSVVRLTPEDGEALVRVIVELADKLLLDPLVPTSLMQPFRRPRAQAGA